MLSEPRLRAHLGIGDDVPAPRLVDMEARAIAFIESQTRRYFGMPQQVTEYLSGNGSRHLRLSEYATMDSGAVVEERRFPGGDPTLIDEFEIRDGEKSSYLVRLGGPKWCYGLEYAATYTRGYVTDGGPPDIEQLILDLLTLRVSLEGKEGLRSETIGGYSYTRFGEGDLDSIDTARGTIEAWRHKVFA